MKMILFPLFRRVSVSPGSHVRFEIQDDSESYIMQEVVASYKDIAGEELDLSSLPVHEQRTHLEFAFNIFELAYSTERAELFLKIWRGIPDECHNIEDLTEKRPISNTPFDQRIYDLLSNIVDLLPSPPIHGDLTESVESLKVHLAHDCDDPDFESKFFTAVRSYFKISEQSTDIPEIMGRYLARIFFDDNGHEIKTLVEKLLRDFTTSDEAQKYVALTLKRLSTEFLGCQPGHYNYFHKQFCDVNEIRMSSNLEEIATCLVEKIIVSETKKSGYCKILRSQ